MYVRARVLITVNPVGTAIQVIIELGPRGNGHTINDYIKRFVRPVDIIVFDIDIFIGSCILIMCCSVAIC